MGRAPSGSEIRCDHRIRDRELECAGRVPLRFVICSDKQDLVHRFLQNFLALDVPVDFLAIFIVNRSGNQLASVLALLLDCGIAAVHVFGFLLHDLVLRSLSSFRTQTC